MKMDLQVNISQKMVLSQAMQQSLVFLQLPLLELNTYVRELSLSNPLIELSEASSGDSESSGERNRKSPNPGACTWGLWTAFSK